FNDWINGRIKKYEFIENSDFIAITEKKVTAQGNESEYKDYAITIEMAKELSMVENNEQGRKCRKYFIQVEKAWNSPEMIMKRALEIANKQVESLKLENNQQKQIIGELKPKADYTDSILQNKGLVTITQIAKDYGMSGQAMNNKLHELKVQYQIGNQWLLYSKYQAKGYTHSETIPITHKDGTKDVRMNTKWTQKGRLFVYDLLKTNGILPTIEREAM
ncbi:MAG: phage antirepressor KilAC domain-containing protein, partial [Clostridium sp.]|nr:phage antirepressor KilAC domain-containing protein [Clostridium sp.]